MLDALLDLPATPLEVLLLLTAGAVALVLVGDIEQPLGAVITAIEHHILDGFAQLFRQVVIDRQLAGVDDAHGEPCANRVVEKYRVDRLAHRIVAAKREGHVGNAARHHGVRQVFANPAGGLDEVHRVVVVFVDAGGDGKDVGVEDDVFGGEADIVHQHPVGALADFGLAREGVRLAGLVERHHHHGGAMTAAFGGLVAEGLFAFLERDRVDHRLALDALEAGLDDLPLGGVDHDRHPSDVRLTGDQIEKAHHGFLGLEHPLVHVDVDHLGAVLDLLERYLQGGGVVLFLDQSLEASRACDVGTLTDVDEQRIVLDVERLQARQTAGSAAVRNLARGQVLDRAVDGGDMLGGGTTAATDDVDQATAREFGDDLGHLLGGLVVLAELVGQARVGVSRDEGVGLGRQLLDVGA